MKRDYATFRRSSRRCLNSLYLSSAVEGEPPYAPWTPPTYPSLGYMQLAMPPRSSLTGSFSLTDANNEVVCPLTNQDSSSCRKRCLGVSSAPSLTLGTWNARPRTTTSWTADTYTAHNRRSDFDLCRSIFGELTLIIIFQSFLPPRKASC